MLFMSVYVNKTQLLINDALDESSKPARDSEGQTGEGYIPDSGKPKQSVTIISPGCAATMGALSPWPASAVWSGAGVIAAIGLGALGRSESRACKDACPALLGYQVGEWAPPQRRRRRRRRRWRQRGPAREGS